MARGMDDAVLRSMARWPGVPDVYGWLALDRRGNFRLRSEADPARFERIGNEALRAFIARNYRPDARGCWYFQNGPQRVFVRLEYAPLVVRSEGEGFVDHCGRPFRAERMFLDDEGALLLAGASGLGLLDDRDLGAFAEAAADLPVVPRGAIPGSFRFVPDPGAGILAPP